MNFEELDDVRSVWIFITVIQEFVRCSVLKHIITEPKEIVIGSFIYQLDATCYQLTGTAKKYDVLVFVKNQKDCDNLQIKK